MPVDLSMIGLKGIASGQDTLNSIAQREALQAQTAIQQGEFDRESQALEMDRLAVSNAQSILAGEGRSIGTMDSTEDDMARFMALTGQQLAKAGAPKRGSELMEASLDLIKKKADIDKVADDQDKVRLENMVKASDYMYEMLSDSGNESEYQFNLANIPEDVQEILGPDNVATLKNTPWSPELVDYFKTKALSVKDQATLDMQAQGHRRQDQNAADTALFRRATLDIAKQRADAADRAQEAAKKAGGNNISKAATGDERKTAEAAIGSIIEGDAPLDDPSLFHLVEDVVGEAKQLVNDSPGLTFSEAVNRAALAAKTRGDFEIINSYKDFGVFRTRGEPVSQKYKPKGKAKDTPAPLPEDRTKWVKGRYYIKNGKVGQYGTDFN